MSDDDQPLLDQQLEDMEKTCRVASLTYNDPFKVFETTEKLLAAQRKMLFGVEE